jgi:hypothetical protein
LNVGPYYQFGLGTIQSKLRSVGGNLVVILHVDDTRFHQDGEEFQIQRNA